MKEIERRTIYQPKQLNQGFNAVKAADITPSLRANQQTELQNLKNQADAQLSAMKFNTDLLKFKDAAEQKELQELTQFSGQLFEFVQNMEKERIKDKAAEMQVVYSEMQEARQLAELSQAGFEQELSDNNDATTKQALAAKAQGAPYDIVAEINKRSGHERYFLTVNHLQHVGKDTLGYLKDQKRNNSGTINVGGREIVINNPQNRAEAAAVDSYLVKEHIKNNGVEHVTAGLAAKYLFPEIDKAKASAMQDWEKRYSIESSENAAQLGFEQLKVNYKTNPNAVQQYLNTIRMGVDGKGNDNTYTDAHDRFWEEIEALRRSDDPDDQEIAAELMEQYGKTKLNGKEFSVLHKERFEGSDTELLKWEKGVRADKQAAGKAKADDYIQKGKIRLLEAGDFTKADVAELIKFGHSSYGALGLTYDPGDLMKWWETHSLSGQAYEDLRALTKIRILNRRLTPDEYASLPTGLQQDFAEEYAQLQEFKNGVHKGNLDAFETIVLGNEYVKGAVGTNARQNSDLVIEDLQNRYMDMVTAEVSNPDSRYYGDQRQAGLAVRDQLVAEYNAGVRIEGNRYHHGLNGFGEITRALIGDTDLNLERQQTDRALMVNQVRQNVGVRAWESPNLLGTTEQLRTWSNQIQNGQGVPAFLQAVEKTTGDSWLQILNPQLEAAGLDRVESIDMINQRMAQQTPEIQRDFNIMFSGAMRDITAQRLTGNYTFRPRYQSLAADSGGTGNGVYEPALSMIRGGESSTNLKKAANSANRGVAGDTPEGIPGLDRKTLGDWKQLGKAGWFALGAYQIIPETLLMVSKELGMSDDTVMTLENQGKLAIGLMTGSKRPRLAAYLNGSSNNINAALDDWALEWAAIATASGKSAYAGTGGNAANISRTDARKILQELRANLLSRRQG